MKARRSKILTLLWLGAVAMMVAPCRFGIVNRIGGDEECARFGNGTDTDTSASVQREAMNAQKTTSFNVTTSDDTLSPLIHSLSDDWNFCAKRNIVRGRRVGRVFRMPYSVTSNDFRSFHSNQCDTPADLMFAMLAGHREWDDPTHANLTSIEKERFPSYFVPAHCDVPPLTKYQACSILSYFSYVLTVGDSLVRHLHQALYLVLRGDLVSGGVISSENYMHEQCQCDGQFSEYKGCRSNDGHFFHMADPQKDLGICSHVSRDFELHHVPQEWNGAKRIDRFDIPQLACSSDDKRNVLLYLQSGSHYNFNAFTVIERVIEPVLNDERIKGCNVTVVWQQGDAKSERDMMKQWYPEQTRDKVATFNQRLKDYFATRRKSSDRQVYILDTWNVTADAQSSDGMHYLTDVNLQKAFALLNLAKLVQLQGR